jgi:hypothetical protein
MPTIPLYNQSNTEEAALTRAKKRVVSAMKTGTLKLTERPDIDVTNGKADDVANQLISQMEDLTAVIRSTLVYFEERDNDLIIEERDDVRKVLKLGFTIAKLSRRIAKITKGLIPNVRYLDLGVYSDLRTAAEEMYGIWSDAFVFLTGVQILIDEDDESSIASDVWRSVSSVDSADSFNTPDEIASQASFRTADEIGFDDDDDSELSEVSSQSSRSAARSAARRQEARRQRQEAIRRREAFGRIGEYVSFPDLIMRINAEINTTYELLMAAVDNFNELRQQQVLPPEQIGTEREAALSGSGRTIRSKRPIYRIGNNQDERLYEMAGLPRFI